MAAACGLEPAAEQDRETRCRDAIAYLEMLEVI